MKYLGHLSRNDPLYGYLCREILPQIGFGGASPDFRVYRLVGSNHVYLYEDRHTGVRLVGKFFGGTSDRSPESAFHCMEREFNNLHHLRSLGFTGYPHYIARPLGRNADLGCVLVEEYCCGRPLTDFILEAMRERAREPLFEKLGALAYFLATLHNRTASQERVDFERDCAYFDRIVGRLENWGHMDCHEARELHRLKERWREKECMWQDSRVLVHGDVTPANILFGDGPWVIAIDLERMKAADRVLDVGRVAGELKHFFMRHTGDPSAAEPFINHFVWEYACHFPDRHGAFAGITRRLPFHMGVTLLRIARNTWIDGEHRRQLLDEARKTLR